MNGNATVANNTPLVANNTPLVANNATVTNVVNGNNYTVSNEDVRMIRDLMALGNANNSVLRAKITEILGEEAQNEDIVLVRSILSQISANMTNNGIRNVIARALMNEGNTNSNNSTLSRSNNGMVGEVNGEIATVNASGEPVMAGGAKKRKTARKTKKTTKKH